MTRAPVKPPRGSNLQSKPTLEFRAQTTAPISTQSVQNRSWIVAAASHACRVARENPGKTFAYFWGCVFLLVSPIYGANVALQVQQWGCPKLPPWFAGLILCPERERVVVRSPEANVPSKASVFDPRTELFKEMGIAWSEANFWDAVKRGDSRATELFLRGGMSINSRELHTVLSDVLLTRKASLPTLIKFGVPANEEFCSSDDEGQSPSTTPVHRSVARFAGYAQHEAVLGFVRAFCVGRDIVAPLRKHLSLERQALADIKSSNKQNEGLVRSCESELSASAFDALLKTMNDQIEKAYVIYCQAPEINAGLPRELCNEIANSYGETELKEAQKEENIEYTVLWKEWVPSFCKRKYRQAVEPSGSRIEDLESALTAYK